MTANWSSLCGQRASDTHIFGGVSRCSINQLAVLLGGLMGLSGGAFGAPVTWVVDGMLRGGGTIAGSFVYDASTREFSSIDLLSDVTGIRYSQRWVWRPDWIYFRPETVAPGNEIGLELAFVSESYLASGSGTFLINDSGAIGYMAEFVCVPNSDGVCGSNGLFGQSALTNWDFEGRSTVTAVTRFVLEPSMVSLLAIASMSGLLCLSRGGIAHGAQRGGC